MYRYAETRNRLHRVYIEGGRAFKVENCNLDDVGFLNLQDNIPTPAKPKCAYCWAGYVEPTPEQEAAAAAATPTPPDPAKSKPIALVTSTRRMALATLVGAALLGTAAGVMASPKAAIPNLDNNPDVAALRTRIDDLFVQVRVLQVDLEGLANRPTSTSAPAPTAAPPVVIVLPTADPTDKPSSVPLVVPTASPAAATIPSGSGKQVVDKTTIIIQQPVSTAAPGINQQSAPTPTPTSVPTANPTSTPTPTCFRPAGHSDPCKWPHQPK
jgi:hypothetical protein